MRQAWTSFITTCNCKRVARELVKAWSPLEEPGALQMSIIVPAEKGHLAEGFNSMKGRHAGRQDKD